LFAPHIHGVILHIHSVRAEPCIQRNASREVATTSPPFKQTTPIARFLCKGCTRHDLHILVTAQFFCDQKSPSSMCGKLRIVAASNSRVHLTRSLYYCLFAPHIYGVVLCTHSVHGGLHIQRNASGEVATVANHLARPRLHDFFKKVIL